MLEDDQTRRFMEDGRRGCVLVGDWISSYHIHKLGYAEASPKQVSSKILKFLLSPVHNAVLFVINLSVTDLRGH